MPQIERILHTIPMTAIRFAFLFGLLMATGAVVIIDITDTEAPVAVDLTHSGAVPHEIHLRRLFVKHIPIAYHTQSVTNWLLFLFDFGY